METATNYTVLNEQKDEIIKALTDALDVMTSKIDGFASERVVTMQEHDELLRIRAKLVAVEHELKVTKYTLLKTQKETKELREALDKVGKTGLVVTKAVEVDNAEVKNAIAQKKKIDPTDNLRVVKVTEASDNYSIDDRLHSNLGELLKNVKVTEAEAVEVVAEAEVVEAEVEVVSVEEVVAEKTEVDETLRLSDSHGFDWEERLFFKLASPKYTALRTIFDLGRASNVIGAAESAAYYIEVEEDEDSEAYLERADKLYKSDYMNNGYIMRNGLIDTSKLLMADDSVARKEISRILNTEPRAASELVVSLAVFYDSTVRGFSTDEIMTNYGITKEKAEEYVGGIENLFKAKQLGKRYTKYLSVDAVCWIDSSMNKHNLTAGTVSLPKLYTLYIKGYAIEELLSVLKIKEHKNRFTDYLKKFNAYKELSDEDLVMLKKDSFKKEFGEEKLSEVYGISDVMARHYKNRVARYFNIIGGVQE